MEGCAHGGEAGRGACAPLTYPFIRELEEEARFTHPCNIASRHRLRHEGEPAGVSLRRERKKANSADAPVSPMIMYLKRYA